MIIESLKCLSNPKGEIVISVKDEEQSGHITVQLWVEEAIPFIFTHSHLIFQCRYLHIDLQPPESVSLQVSVNLVMLLHGVTLYCRGGIT